MVHWCQVVFIVLVLTSLCKSQSFQPLRVGNLQVLGTVQQEVSNNIASLSVKHILGSARSAVSNGNAQTQDLPSFYVGAYWSLTPPGLSSNATVATSVPGAIHEILAAFQYLFIYYNNDNFDGYQFPAGSTPFTQCDSTTSSSNVDCVDPRDVIDLSTLSWATIRNTVNPCPNGQYSSFLEQCKLWSATMVGSLNGTVTIELIATTATHPIQITTVTGEYSNVKPGAQKIDVTIFYPWDQRKSTLANPRIGLAVWSATLSSQTPIFNVTQIVYLNNVLTASFEWNPVSFCYVGSLTNMQPSVVYNQIITGSAVANLNCGGVSWCTGLQQRKVSYDSLGWTSNLIFFSWKTVSIGDIIVWDPTSVVSGSSFRTVFSFTAGVISLVFYWLFV